MSLRALRGVPSHLTERMLWRLPRWGVKRHFPRTTYAPLSNARMQHQEWYSQWRSVGSVAKALERSAPSLCNRLLNSIAEL